MGAMLRKKRSVDEPDSYISPPIQSQLNGDVSHHRDVFHQEEILDVAAVESDCVVIGGSDAKALIVNLATGEAIGEFERHEKAILKVSYSNELQSGFSSSRDAGVFMWPHTTSSDVYKGFNGHSLAVTGLALSCEASRLATGSRDNYVMMWDIHTGLRAAQSAVSRNVVTHVCWCVKSVSEFVQTSEDKVVKLWDCRTMSVVQQFPVQRHIQTHCDASTDGYSILTSNSGMNGNGCSVSLWDRRQGKIVREFIGHKSTVNQAIFLDCNFTGCIASCSADCTVKLWDINSGDCCVSEYVNGATSLTSLCVVENKHLVCGSQKRGINVFEMSRTSDQNCVLKYTGNL